MDSIRFFSAALLLLVLPSLLQFTSSENTTSYSLNLVHCDSPESPLYPGAMTFQEKLDRYMKMSRSRASYLKSTRMEYHGTRVQPEDEIHSVMSVDFFSYFVQLGIGNPVKKFSLLLDTGSGLSWTQCQPCKKCYQKEHPIYDPKASTSFEKLLSNHSACRFFKRDSENQCSYDYTYLDGSSTRGYAVWDSLTISSPGRQDARLKKFLFGCSTWNELHHQDTSNWDGIFGMNRNPVSFIMQMGASVKSRFSYCLVDPSMDNPPMSYLKFGTDILSKGGEVQTTPLVNDPNYHYNLLLTDVSVNNKRMNFPPGTFAPKLAGKGGFIIDTGSVFTFIDDKAYPKLEAEFISYFSGFRTLIRRKTCMDGSATDLCYDAPKGFPVFPTMTYHFQAAKLTLPPEHLFIIDRKKMSFYLTVVPHPDGSILGAFQQQNTRFTYDLVNKAVSFVHEDCAKDKP